MHYYYFFIFSQYSSKMLYLLHKFLLLSKNNFVLCRKRACSGQSFTECYLLKMLLKTRDGWSNDFRKCDLLHWNFRGSEMFCRKETWLSLFSSVQLLSRVWLCDPMNRSTPGLPVHHQLPESTQTHVHRVSDGIQPSHPLSSPSPPALNLSQYQVLSKWVSSSHQVAKVLEF